jgi:hypothetical protein
MLTISETIPPTDERTTSRATCIMGFVRTWLPSTLRQGCPGLYPVTLHTRPCAWRRQTSEPHVCCPPAHRRDPGIAGRVGSPRGGTYTARDST